MVKNSSRELNIDRVPELDIEMPSPKERTRDRVPIAARLGPINEDSPVSERLPIAARLGPFSDDYSAPRSTEHLNDNEGERVPISFRLGPVPVQEDAEAEASKAPLDKKRKRGRPPGTRLVKKNGDSLTETNTQKKKTLQEKPPTGKKKTGTETARPRIVTKVTKNKRSTPRSRVASTPTPSENLPLANMIPPSARRRMDFRVPSHPVP